MARPLDIYLEIGRKKTFAGAIDWPGWCRSGRDEQAALDALSQYASRYAPIAAGAGLDFPVPAKPAALAVVERLEGGSTTDFGAPEVAPAADARPVDDADLRRLVAILEACWQAFDAAVRAAAGKELRKGPRGGGRDLDRIVEHVLGADAAYLSQLGGKAPKGDDDPAERLRRTRQAIRDTLGAAARGEIPATGPRGGARWSPRYFVRRSAWHVLDHAWEIQDRME